MNHLWKFNFGLKQGKVKDGKKDGEWLYYIENGQLYLKNTYKDGKKDGEIKVL